MASMIPVKVRLTAGAAVTSASMQCRTWTPGDGRVRALRWGGAMFGVSLFMLPIPIVHFGVIPLVLIGIPIVTTVVYRAYRSGTDLIGTALCPACQAPQIMQASANHWPIRRLCHACREPYQISLETP